MDPGESSSTQAQENSTRDVTAAHQGKPFAVSWVSQKREGMLKQGKKSLFVDSDIINLHLGLISFGIEIFFLTAGISHLCLVCTPQTEKARDCWPSL